MMDASPFMSNLRSPEGIDEKEYLFVDTDYIEFFQVFLEEAPVFLADVQTNLMLLSSNQTADIQQVYRSFHILQNQWGFLGFYQMKQLCEKTENFLEFFLSGTEVPKPDQVDVLLKAMASCRLQSDRMARGLYTDRVEVWDVDPVLEALNLQISTLIMVASAAKTMDVFAPALESYKLFSVRDERMNDFLELVGELIVHQSEAMEESSGPSFGGKNAAAMARATKTVKKIRDFFLSFRLVSCQPLFEHAEWIVQQFSWKTKKKIRWIFEGTDVLVDSLLFPVLSGVLLQLLKNVVDHGIEPESERLAAGKNAEGVLKIKAAQQAGSFLLEVEDDGRGLDMERLKKKGIALGMLSDTKAPASRILEMIFKPGFTTLDGITEGRGMGLDQVGNLVESVYGSIRVQSHSGQGCKFTLKFPQSLSLIEGWVVEAGQKQWILPISQVWKITHPTPSVTEKALPPEEALLPSLDLGRWLGDEEKANSPKFSVHVESGSHQFRILVDEVRGKQQVLIKKKGRDAVHKPGIKDEAILSDGKMGFILDTGELVKLIQ